MYVFCVLFNVNLAEIQLSKIWFSLKSGVISFGLFDVPLMDCDTGEFRLTPNIFEIIGQAGLDGVMPAVIINAFDILLKELPQVFNIFKLILDEKNIDYHGLENKIKDNCNYTHVTNCLENSKNTRTDSIGWIPWF